MSRKNMWTQTYAAYRRSDEKILNRVQHASKRSFGHLSEKMMYSRRRAVQASELKGNLDHPEAGLDGLMQVITIKTI